jgi:hypothetical protein
MAAREKYLLGWFPKVARKLGGLSFPIVSPPPSEREGRRRKKKKIRPQQGKKEYGQIEVAVEQVVEGGNYADASRWIHWRGFLDRQN